MAADLSEDVKALHVLNRLAYGPRPGDVDRVKALGTSRYIEQQLSPQAIPLTDNLTNRLAQLDTLRLTPVDLFTKYGPRPLGGGQKPTPEEIKSRQREGRIIMEQAVHARLLRAIESPRQLEEVMVEFWFNHFNVFAGKGLDRLWTGAYEEEAIRPHVLGNFRDLLGATARHPAMLFYLDNWQNTAPGSPGARGKLDGINENYARELMELHTLGVDGGYTQQDVIALAKILTGWGIRRANARADDVYGFHFDARRHDFGDKQFLGHSIRGRGMQEGEDALDILAASPVTARRIGYQLAQYFVADEPSPELVDQLAQRYRDTRGDIREMLKTLFGSREFWEEKSIRNKFKTPYQYIVSAVRATGVPVTNIRPIYGMLMQLGMPIYGCPTPDGYKQTQEAWLNPDAMMRRLSFVTALASGRLPLDRPPTEVSPMPVGRMKNEGPSNMQLVDVQDVAPIDSAQLTAALGSRFSDRTLKTIADSPERLRSALILGSPEFMRR